MLQKYPNSWSVTMGHLSGRSEQKIRVKGLAEKKLWSCASNEKAQE